MRTNDLWEYGLKTKVAKLWYIYNDAKLLRILRFSKSCGPPEDEEDEASHAGHADCE
jgi:hypothetical protein